MPPPNAPPETPKSMIVIPACVTPPETPKSMIVIPACVTMRHACGNDDHRLDVVNFGSAWTQSLLGPFPSEFESNTAPRFRVSISADARSPCIVRARTSTGSWRVLVASAQGRKTVPRVSRQNVHTRASPRRIGVKDTSSQNVEQLRPHSYAHGGTI